MRKWLALLLVCLLVPFAAMAESELVTYEFADFTIDLPSGIVGELYEKNDQEVYFIVFPDYNENDVFHPNLNCVWVEGYDDMDTINANSTAQFILNSAVSQMAAQNVTVTNEKLLAAAKEDINGKPGLVIGFSYDISYDASMEPLTLYAFQAIASHESIGTYTFTITTHDINTVESILGYVDTIVWTK